MSHLFKKGVIALLGTLCFAVANSAGAESLILTDNSTEGSGQSIVALNPQPEPPSFEIQYQLTPDGADWFGMVYVGGEACGTMQLLQTTPKQTGVATHVGYDLSITGDNPAFQLDASLAGVIVKQRVVLNGTVDSGYYAGRTVHPRGTIQTFGGGPIDQITTLQGTIKLNPQPEPPSFEFPPSPCAE